MTAALAPRPVQLTDEFPPADVLHFTKTWRGKDGRERSMTFDYIEDETVMDRLDEVVGPLNWSIKVEPISLAEGVVKVRLEVGGAVYEDFGYQNRDDGEALKEAVSDGIRRVGRMAGIGRYLYRKHDSPATRPPRVEATAAAPSRPAAVANPYAQDPYPPNITEMDSGPEPELTCPDHRKPYRLRANGSKYCPTKVGDGWCQQPR